MVKKTMKRKRIGKSGKSRRFRRIMKRGEVVRPGQGGAKDDQKERTYDHNGIAPFSTTTLGSAYLSQGAAMAKPYKLCLKSNNRSYNIYINI